MTPGDVICAGRKRRGFTLRKLAAFLGCSLSYLHDIEKGRRSLSDAMAKRIGEALGIELTCPTCGRARRQP